MITVNTSLERQIDSMLYDFDCNSEEYMQLIRAWLGVTSNDQITTETTIFGFDEDEEPWDLPAEFEKVIEIDHLHCPTFTWGYVGLYRYRGRLVVAECNASPWIFYTAKVV